MKKINTNTRRLDIRVNETFFNKMHELSKKQGMPISKIIRAVVMQEYQREFNTSANEKN